VTPTGSPRSELGVDHIRARIVPYFGRYEFDRERTPSFTVGDLVLRRNSTFCLDVGRFGLNSAKYYSSFSFFSTRLGNL
jgi:hypothetical protein